MKKDNTLYTFLIENCLIKNFSNLKDEEFKLFLFMENLEKSQYNKITDVLSNSNIKWEKIYSNRNMVHELTLITPFILRNYLDSFIYEIHEDEKTNRQIIRLPEYLLNCNFRQNNTEITYGSKEFTKFKMVTNVFGNLISHGDGVMSYIKIDEMCIYLHKYIKIENNQIKYINKYILEPFARFEANEMLIYRVKDIDDFSKELDDYLSTKYTVELFNKSFFELSEDELILLKMEII